MNAPNTDYGPCNPDGWGQRVSGRCPACGLATLFVAAGQHITCGNIPCPDPTMVADFLLGERTHIDGYRAGDQP